MKSLPELLIGMMVVCAVAAFAWPTQKINPDAEYCAEEMITREVIDGRLTEHRHCASWVGWPIQVVEVAK